MYDPDVVLTLTEIQRQAILDEGSPIAVIDGESGQPYVLLNVDLIASAPNSVHAKINGIPATGEGDSPEDALVALTLSLKSYLLYATSQKDN